MWKSLFRHSAAFLLMAAAISAQSPAFEVATIKPAPPLDAATMKMAASGQLRVGMSIDAGRVDIGMLSLADLIRVAYRIKPYQLTGPDRMPAQRWNIQAKIPEGASVDKVPEMLQALLEDRFQLKIHRSNADHPIYALVVGKNGTKLKPADPDPAPADKAADAPAPPAGKGEMVLGSGDGQMRIKQNADGRGSTITNAKLGQVKVSMAEAGAMRMEFSKMKMADLADMLAPFADRPVLDMTDLPGSYQVSLELSIQDMMRVAQAAGAGFGLPAGPAPAGNPSQSPADAASTPANSVFTAVQQLGLRLDPRKAPVEMIVVDHLEKTPTEN